MEIHRGPREKMANRRLHCSGSRVSELGECGNDCTKVVQVGVRENTKVVGRRRGDRVGRRSEKEGEGRIDLTGDEDRSGLGGSRVMKKVLLSLLLPIVVGDV